MARPVNRSYFPLWRTLPEHHVLTRKQVAAARRALAKQGLKLPRPGYCTITTKVAGKYRNIVASSQDSTSEICHERRNGKVVYVLRATAARSRRSFR